MTISAIIDESMAIHRNAISLFVNS